MVALACKSGQCRSATLALFWSIYIIRLKGKTGVSDYARAESSRSGWSAALPRVHATLVITHGGSVGVGVIVTFVFHLLHAKSREGVSADGEAMVIRFCMETEIDTVDGIIF